MRFRLLALIPPALAAVPAAATDAPLTVERLLSDGWDIAGYAGTADNRSSLLLFRRKDRNYLVQCSALYDVTRSPRPTINCYELR